MISDHDKELLQRFVAIHDAFRSEAQKTVEMANDLDEMLRFGLRSGGALGETLAVLAVLPHASYEYRKKLLPELVECCLSTRLHTRAMQLILDLPLDWLASHIEEAAYPKLEGADHIDYDFALQLFDKISSSAAHILARHATESPDPDIREKGTQYLDQTRP